MPPKRVVLMVAADLGGVIGKGPHIPWRLPRDLKRLRTLTMGKPVIMGRKTWETLNGKPLEGRTNIVVSSTLPPTPGIHVERTVLQALYRAEDVVADETVILGGGEIYAATLAEAQRIYLTIVDHVFDGDAFFPALKDGEWRSDPQGYAEHPADEKNPYPMRFFDLWRTENAPPGSHAFSWDQQKKKATASPTSSS